MANIVTTNPQNFASNVIRNVFIYVTFDTALNRDTISDSTCLLFKESDQSIISGVVDYLPATKKITFQLREVLEANTDYSLLIMGGASGVKQLVNNEPFNSSSYLLNFTTGASIDVTIPLAAPEGQSAATGGWFLGEDGIYTFVWGATGEAISHIVTTAGQVGLSGVIRPHPAGGELYITEADAPNNFVVESTLPNDEDVLVVAEEDGVVSITFNHVPNSDWNFSLSGMDVNVEHVLGEDMDDFEYSTSVYGYNLLLSGELEYNANYTITLDSEYLPNADEFSSEYDIHNYTLGEDYTFNFRTEYSPFFSTVSLVRQLGSVVSHIEDYDIEKLILQSSLYIYSVSDPTIDIDDPSTEAQQYVLCKTQWELLNQMLWEGGDVSSRGLGAFSVRYGRRLDRMMERKLEDLERCIEKSLRSVVNSDSIDYVVKSEEDERRPINDDSWIRLDSQRGFEEQ